VVGAAGGHELVVEGSQDVGRVQERAESLPRQAARTRRFTLGQPRRFAVARDGSRVAFLRSRAGDDPATCLWAIDLAEGREWLVADPGSLGDGGGEDLSPEERARRERARELAEGIVQYAADPDLRRAAFALNGELWVADLSSQGARPVPARAPGFDPRLDPTGRRIAYVSGRALRAVEADGAGTDLELAHDEDPEVSWGMAEFVAAEEMERDRGYWWSPQGDALAAARVDTTPVKRWHIADPANPEAPPQVVAYPAAGTANAIVTLHIVGLDGTKTPIEWDGEAFPYLVNVTWSESGPLTLLVQARDQRHWLVLGVDHATGATRTLWEDRDDAWLHIVPGVPAWTDGGRLVMTADRDDTRGILLDGSPATPPGLNVHRVVSVSESVVFVASGDDPLQRHLWALTADGELTMLSKGDGVHDGAAGGGVVVDAWTSMDHDGVRAEVRDASGAAFPIRSFAERPVIRPDVSFLRAGPREIRTAVLFPSDGGSGPLPVLLDPYGGPHFQRVTLSRNAFLESQWFADQGFAVVVADGRGTPSRGVGWEKVVRLNLTDPVLEDQVEALHRTAERYPRLDLSRVAIRGWSFGGELAALAVLRRPDVFHAAAAGASVTDQRLYDTHYTERYLGHPGEHPDVYERHSLIADAPRLERPLLLIHGLADDNVVVAHTLRLSNALLEAGRPHRLLLLSGITHMTPKIEEFILMSELHFLREALHLEAPT
jgi:dipeptidyl-peptidase-4